MAFLSPISGRQINGDIPSSRIGRRCSLCLGWGKGTPTPSNGAFGGKHWEEKPIVLNINCEEPWKKITRENKKKIALLKSKQKPDVGTEDYYEGIKISDKVYIKMI